MPILKKVNQDFFKTWSPDMAYVLGFFTADGSMYKTNRGTHFIEFQITDKKLLENIRSVLGSNHKMSVRPAKSKNWKTRYRLQIGSKTIFNDLRGVVYIRTKAIRFAFPRFRLNISATFFAATLTVMDASISDDIGGKIGKNGNGNSRSTSLQAVGCSSKTFSQRLKNM